MNKEIFTLKAKNVKRVKFCDGMLSIVPHIPSDKVGFIVNKSVEFYNETYQNTGNVAASLVALDMMCESLMAQYCTNLDAASYNYDELVETGFFSLLSSKVANYNDIKNLAHQTIMMTYFDAMSKTFSTLPSADEMISDTTNMLEKFASNPEKAKEFATIALANDPKLRAIVGKQDGE